MDFLQLTLHFFVKVQKTKELGEGLFWRLSNFELKLKKNEANMSSQNLLVNSKHFEQLPSKFWGWTHEQFLRKNGFLQLTLHFFVKVQKTKELGEGLFWAI